MSWSRRLWRTLPIALVIVLAAATAVFAGAPPTSLNVEQVTGFAAGEFPAYCGSGATVQVKFGYISNPDNPGTTEASILLLDRDNTKVGDSGWHTFPDGDNTAPGAWGSLNVVTPTGAPDATQYKIVLQVANSNSSPNWVQDIQTPGLEVDLTGPGPVSGVYVTGDVPTSDSTPQFNWSTATYDRAGIRSYWVAVNHLDTAPAGSAMTDTMSDGLSWTSSALADGSDWYFHIRAQDKAFNYGDAVTFGPFTVDTVAPDLSQTSPIGWANVIKPNVVITAVEDTSGIDEGTTIFTLIGSGTGNIAGSGGWTGLVYTFVPTDDLNEDESYTATMDVDDNAGNHAAQLEFTFEVDVQAPTISALTPADDTWVTTATPAISAKVEDETDGSGIASSTIVMKVDGATVVHAYDPVSGVVSFTPGVALSEGTHTVTVDVKDVAGNAATQASWTFKVDTVAPVLNETSPIDWANVIKPNVVITAVEATSGIDTTNPGSTVFTLSDGAPVAGTGAWDPTGLVYTFVPDGDLNETATYTATMDAKDNAGNSATQLTWTFHVDVTKPTIDNLAPANDAWVTTATPTISAQVHSEANGSGIDADTIVMKVDGVTVVHTYADPTVSFTPAGLTEGTHTVTVDVKDVAGNAAIQASWTFKVDTIKPTLSGTPLGWANVIKPNVVITAVEAGSGLDTGTGTFTVVGGTSGDITAAGSGGWDGTKLIFTWTPGSDLNENEEYTVTMSGLKDVAGNASDPSPLIFTFHVDVQKPTISALTPADDTWVTTATPTISAQVHSETDGSGIDATTIVMKVDGVTVSHDYSAPPTVSFMPAGLTEGTHTVTVDVKDVAGNAATQASWTFKVDTIKPTLSGTPLGWATTIKPDVVITAVEAGSGMNTGVGTLTLTGDISGPIGGSGSWDGTKLIYTWTPTNDLNETETYTATMTGAADIAGNASDPSPLTFTFQVDAQPPTISGLLPTDDTWVATGTPTIQATVQDIGSGIDESTIVMAVDGPTVAHAYASGTGVVSYIPSSALSEGAHTVTVDVSDNAGNAATQTSWTFKVDTVDPVIDEGTWAGPWAHEPGHWTSSTSPTITVAADDPGADDASPTGSGIDASTASATLNLNGGLIALPGSVNYATGVITVALSGLVDGEYELTVGIDDNVGNSATPKSVTFHVDATGPDFANSYPLNGYETNNRGLAPHINVTDAGAGVGVDPDSIAWTMTGPTDPVAGTESWNAPTSTYTADEPLTPDGWYELSVYAEDLLDNDSTYPVSPNTWEFLLDTTAPVLDGIELDVYREIPDVDGVIYTPLKEPNIRVDFHDPEPGSGFNGVVCDVPGKFDVYVYADADMTVPVDGTLNPDARPLDNSAPWGGEWAPTAELADGDYFVKVVITDDAGNTRDPATYDFRFIVDTKPPDIDNSDSEVGFLNGNNGRRFANSRILEVKWDRTPDPEAEPGVPGSGLLGYEFEIWTKAETDVDPTGEYLQYGYTDEDYFYGDWLDIVEPTGTETEVYTMRRPAGFESGKSYGAWLKAYDMLHNGSDWFDPPFIFDPDAPTDPGEPEVQDLKPDRRTNDSTPALKWAHSTDEKVVAQSGVDLYEVQITAAGTTTWDIHYEVDIPDEDVDKVGSDSPLTGDFSWTVPAPLANGVYEVRVRAKDVAGNYSNWVVIAEPFTIDTQAPPVPGMPVTTSPTKNTTPTWTWKHITDSDLERYNVYLDGSLKGSIYGPWPLGMTQVTWPTPEALGHGLHVLEVTSVDDLGNESAKSTQGHVFIDLNAPAVPGAPVPEEDPTKKSEQRWHWSYMLDAVRFEVQWKLSDDDEEWPADDVVHYATAEQTCVTTFSGNGVTGQLRVRAVDALNNKSEWSDAGEVYVDTVEPNAPQNLALWPSDELPMGEDLLLFTSSNRPGVTWDPVSDAVAYRVSVDGHTYLPTDQSSWLWPTAHDSECLGDGPHLVVVTAIDEAGNESIPEAPGPSAYSGGGWLWFIVDTTGPEKPGMPSTTKSPTNNSTPEWTWAPSSVDPEATEPDDMLSGFSHYNIYLDGELVVLDEEDEPITEPAFQCELTDGLHVLEVTSVDRLGNESERSTAGHVLVDTVDPTPPVMKVLPPFTNAATVRFEWTKSSADTDHYEISYTVGDGEEWSDPLEVAGEFYVVDISDVRDGVAVTGKVRAYDKAGNKSVWSNELLGAPIASTIVDRTGPEVTITKPTEAVITNAAKFRYEWTAIDAGCGVASYTVEFNGSRHQVDETSVDNKYWYEATLIEGDNTFKVFATDKLGNVGGTKAAAIVKQVKPQIILVQPMPGAKYKINEISTIAFQVIGLVVDEESQYIRPEILVNGEPLADWRIVPVVEPPGTAKFYVLLDGDVMVPGTMGIRITVGAGSELFSYTVDSERSGFGFGRLRPW